MAIHTAYSARMNSAYAPTTRRSPRLPASAANTRRRLATAVFPGAPHHEAFLRAPVPAAQGASLRPDRRLTLRHALRGSPGVGDRAVAAPAVLLQFPGERRVAQPGALLEVAEDLRVAPAVEVGRGRRHAVGH